MGTQQILLIAVGVVIIGIMIAIGLFMFRDQAAATARDSISNDLVALATASQKYYRRPSTFGGGGNSFGGLTMSKLTTKPYNANGDYVLTPPVVPASATSITITGTGTELGSDGLLPVKLTMTVMADSILLVTTN